MDFDDIDVRMLDNLQKHGRMTNVELARKVGISPPPCLRRLRIMEKKGLLSGYHAIVDPEQTGFTVSAFCVVSLVSQASKTVDSFLQIVEKECNIRSCFSTSGNKSFVLTIVAKNLQSNSFQLFDRRFCRACFCFS